jgi:hypothetical protein
MPGFVEVAGVDRREREVMGLFGQIVRTVVNVATLPVAVTKDVFTLGGVATEQDEPYVVQKLQQIKDEASEELGKEPTR